MKVVRDKNSELRGVEPVPFEPRLQAADPMVRFGSSPARRQEAFRSLPPQGGVSTCAGQRGVALVMTLILLAVIAFMAIAFLVLSSRERGSVGITTQMNVAQYAADSGMEHALQELNAQLMVSANPYSIGLHVSTNYLSPGYDPSRPIGVPNPTNVNYDVTTGLVPRALTSQEMLQNLANLQYSPRPPVYIPVRPSGSNDFRYYLDLNRNGKFEPTGWLGVTNELGQPIRFPNGNIVPGYFVGDPQWVGDLELPDKPHSANNPFLSRHAYIVLPVSETLDINYIHNQAHNPYKTAIGFAGADFLRNQGVGSWEINLASFLYDLNTNIYAWGGVYTYDPLVTGTVQGNAFVDACSLLTNRYGGLNYRNLSSVRSLYANGTPAFLNDGFDGYSAGPINTAPGNLTPDPDRFPGDRTIKPWPGSDTTNRFFTAQELFDPTKTSVNFANRLKNVGLLRSTYDSYTYYRLLSQLGTDSTPDTGKININYDSLVQTNAQGIASSTNFVPWQPIAFFTNTAIALLANAGYTVGPGLTNILTKDKAGRTHLQVQVWPVNYYAPSVHRLFQLAANICDATTNRVFNGSAAAYPYCPSVFRPLFRSTKVGTNTVIVIAGYREVNGIALSVASSAPQTIDPSDRNANLAAFPPLTQPDIGSPDRVEPLVWGVPLVIGAKKGLPNFNEFSMQAGIYVSRLLEFRRAPNDTRGAIKSTNQMYVVGVTNVFGLEAWNSYKAAYPRRLQVVVASEMRAILTNEFGINVWSNTTLRGSVTNLTAGSWIGWTNANQVGQSFYLPFGANSQFMFLPNSTYINRAPWFETQTHNFTDAAQGGFYVPHWFLNLNTRLKYILVDSDAQRIVDYVNLDNWEKTVDVTAKLQEGATCSGNTATLQEPAEQWCTNRLNRANPLNTAIPTYGIQNQIDVCLGQAAGSPPTLPDIRSFNQDPFTGLDAESAVDGFRYNLLGWSNIFPKDANMPFYRSNVFYAPFDPYRPIYVHTTWQANDPLVHYTIGDLVDLSIADTNRVDLTGKNPPLENMGQGNSRYEPWGGNPFGARSNPSITPYDFAAKDPNLTRSDDWDFPTNKFPNIGWLGRVHRGTPWQTIYLKSQDAVNRAPNQLLKDSQKYFGNWKQWVGNPYPILNYGQISSSIIPYVPVPQIWYTTNWATDDAVFSLPTNDWRIVDLFTTALNDNASRGQLSVNQTNLAAWSAVLAGVNVLKDSQKNNYDFIKPAGAYVLTSPPPVVRIVSGIINARTNFPNSSFQRVGDVLAARELTLASPYLVGNTNFMSDEVVERIPQQVLGLLRGNQQPRFVIYSYGQALKPAPRSLVTSGTFVGMCTNYQITAEVATRAVVRIDGAPNNPHAVIESYNILPPD
jgi:hypothetical protein